MFIHNKCAGVKIVTPSNEDTNILVLNTQVYSNTGGQSSKSSNLGSIASFTASGKKNYKKDLARIAGAVEEARYIYEDLDACLEEIDTVEQAVDELSIERRGR